MKPAIGLQVRGESARFAVVTAALFLGATPAAHAAVTISSGTTANMSCANDVCAPTAKDAVLNVSDLENMLAAGNVEVTTTGSGVQAKDIVVKVALTWSASNALTLDAYQSITINKPVSVAGLSTLALTANDGGKNGELSFGPKGNVTFANLSSSLTINGAAYMLVNTVQSLASAIANNPSGDFALASSYNAKQDGTYTSSPISTDFLGVFEGLGNTVSHLKLDDQTQSVFGFFSTIGQLNPMVGEVRDFGISRANVEPVGAEQGMLAGWNFGSISSCHVGGQINESRNRAGVVGGLVARNFGSVVDSYSTATVSGPNTAKGVSVGGLVGFNEGTIANSFATGAVTGGDGTGWYGGLVGVNYDTGSTILNSYATGAVTVGNAQMAGGNEVGGLAGVNGGDISDSYSTGSVTSGANSYAGGFIGDNGGNVTSAYWDTTTSGTDIGVGFGNSSGVTGLTTEQLQSGLPLGFDPSVWREKSNINGGLPYLLADPPR